MTDQHTLESEPANLRFLRRLVTVLTITMILGIGAIFTLLIMRLSEPVSVFAENLNLPVDVTISAITKADDFIAVVTQDGRIFILTSDGAQITQEISLSHQ